MAYQHDAYIYSIYLLLYISAFKETITKKCVNFVIKWKNAIVIYNKY